MVAVELPRLTLVAPRTHGIRVGSSGWRAVSFEPVASTRPTELGLARSRHDYFDTEREVAVVGGTLTSLTTISLLTVF